MESFAFGTDYSLTTDYVLNSTFYSPLQPSLDGCFNFYLAGFK